MKALLLGYSSLARRKILPAFERAAALDGIDIGTRRADAVDRTAGAKIDAIYDSYELALDRSDAELVYVSTVNSLHEDLAERSIRSGRHTYVDKPAFLHRAATERLIELAQRAGVGLGEATVSFHHPRMDYIRENSAARGPIKTVHAKFQMPMFAPGNFRLDPALGGGAFLDLGPYAAAASRVFLGAPPDEIHCAVGGRDAETGLELSFSVLAASGETSLTGHFGYGVEYQNRLMGAGPAWAFDADRAFSPPADMRTTLHIRAANETAEIAFEPADNFQIAIETFIGDCGRGSTEDGFQAMIADAAFTEGLRTAAESHA